MKNKIEVAEYVNGEYVFSKKKAKTTGPLAIIGTVALTALPVVVYASEMDSTFASIHSAIMSAVDAGVVFVIIFAGASWSLGHRSKAIEIIIGVCCGYLLIRNAVNLRDFLKSI